MDKKIIKAIEARTGYPIDVVADWWRRMFSGLVVVDGDTVTFSHPRMDGARAAYSRNVW
jgi:hypothetical protein